MVLLSTYNVDLTITTEKLVELFQAADEKCMEHFGGWLGLPYAKIGKGKGNLTQQRDAYLDLYVSDHPCPSWKTIARALSGVHLHHQAHVVENTYVQGMLQYQYVTNRFPLVVLANVGCTTYA